MSDPQTIIWTIPELGVSTTESALLDLAFATSPILPD